MMSSIVCVALLVIALLLHYQVHSQELYRIVRLAEEKADTYYLLYNNVSRLIPDVDKYTHSYRFLPGGKRSAL